MKTDATCVLQNRAHQATFTVMLQKNNASNALFLDDHLYIFSRQKFFCSPQGWSLNEIGFGFMVPFADESDRESRLILF